MTFIVHTRATQRRGWCSTGALKAFSSSGKKGVRAEVGDRPRARATAKSSFLSQILFIIKERSGLRWFGCPGACQGEDSIA